jgi:hypothetical protein
MESLDYIPGVCNIGPQERILRRMVGYVSLGFFAALWVVFDLTNAPSGLRLLLLIPAFIGSVGFFQDASRFCVNYGIRGLFNLNYSAGVTMTVKESEQRSLDLEKSLEILCYSLITSLALTYLALLFD